MLRRIALAITVVLSMANGSALVAGASTRPLDLVSPLVMARTVNVARCEEGGDWQISGWKYAGGLGWEWATWLAWKAPWMPASMADATPEEQAWAMVRFIDRGPRLKYHGMLMPHGWWPDQVGCTGGY